MTTILSEQEAPHQGYKRHFIAPIFFELVILGGKLWERLTGGELSPLFGFSLCLLTDLAFMGYLLAALIRGFFIWKGNSIQSQRYFIGHMILLSAILVIAITFTLSDIFGLTTLIFYCVYLCGLVVIVYSVFSFRHPEYTQRVIKTVSGKNKRMDHLHAKDTASLMVKLTSLMDGGLYRDPELTLEQVGNKLGLSVAMVSQLINVKAKMNFKSYVNGYRIRAVCEKLRKDPDQSILDIAFENGFNSKSTFNTAFLESTGVTPSEYRKTNGVSR